jgi:hypothetical protein
MQPSISFSVQPILFDQNDITVSKNRKSLLEQYEEERTKHSIGSDEQDNSHNMRMRAKCQNYLTDSFPSLIACLNYHYQLKDHLHCSDFQRAF